MVLPGERDYMAATTTTTGPERSRTLHNFTLPNLKWGSQRHLKCMKIDSTTNGSGGSSDHRLRRRSPPLKFAGSSVSIPFQFREGDNRSNSDNNQHHRLRDNAPFKSVENGSGEEGIEEFRVKIMSDLKTVRDKITQSMFKKDVVEEEQDEERKIDGSGSGSGSSQEKEREISPVKPWNLRKRRAACKEPVSGIEYINSLNKGFAIEEKIVNPSPSRNDWSMSNGKGGLGEAGTKQRRTKLVVQLSKKEIEEDFMAIIGRRPPRRPKKRSRTVQRNLENIFPGMYLSEVTLDAYKVPEEPKV